MILAPLNVLQTKQLINQSKKKDWLLNDENDDSF